MTDFGGARVRARLLTGGYAQAHERFEEAQRNTDPDLAFFALFEALNWAHAVDDLIALTWSPRGKVEGYAWRSDPALGGGKALASVMDGLRYVRNRVHHQWADALVMRPGATLPVRLPTALITWAWRPLEELPKPSRGREDRRGQEAYATVLAEHRADDALEEMSRPFAFIGQLLDPPIATRTAPLVESI